MKHYEGEMNRKAGRRGQPGWVCPGLTPDRDHHRPESGPEHAKAPTHLCRGKASCITETNNKVAAKASSGL